MTLTLYGFELVRSLVSSKLVVGTFSLLTQNDEHNGVFATLIPPQHVTNRSKWLTGEDTGTLGSGSGRRRV